MVPVEWWFLMAAMDSIMRTWPLNVQQLSLSDSPNLEEAADANMVILEVPSSAAVPEVHAALERVLTEYQAKAEHSGKHGLFYAWADVASGTIRCSFCGTSQFDELPFHCTTRRASLAEIASSATEVFIYADGIPRQELSNVEWSDPDDSPILELAVFAASVGVSKDLSPGE